MSSDEKNRSETSEDNTYLRLQQSRVIKTSIEGISQLLNTGLSQQSLDLCMKLIEAGVHPKALADVIIQINQQVANIQSED